MHVLLFFFVIKRDHVYFKCMCFCWLLSVFAVFCGFFEVVVEGPCLNSMQVVCCFFLLLFFVVVQGAMSTFSASVIVVIVIFLMFVAAVDDHVNF